MMNIYFPDEEITDNDLYFICYMIERVARKLHQKNKYVVNTIGRDALKHLISVANVLHCENPLQVEDGWIEEYHLQEGDYDITDVDRELAEIIPTPLEMGNGIAKGGDKMSLLIMAGAFVAACFMNVNVIYIILTCIIFGVVRTLMISRNLE